MRNRIAIIHFSPLELYPPVQNLLRLLEQKNENERIWVLTTQTVLKDIDIFTIDPAKIKLLRVGWSGQGVGLCKRYFTYTAFNILSVLCLLFNGVNKVLYFETLSAYPAWFYKRFLKRRAELFIHYHEYNSPEEYKKGMRLVRYFHKLELRLYPLSAWLSHTNIHRMSQFLKDIEPLKVSNPQLLPNYPSVNWLGKPNPPETNVVKIVYVGAVSLDTMYIKEFADWVNTHNGSVIWDIYSSNITDAAYRFIKTLDSQRIKFCGAVNYSSLPVVLKHYQAGIILYNGHSTNYVFNAPNKLFEYFGCGLDVWFPDVMEGSIPYLTNKTYPKILTFNFSNLSTIDIDEALNKKGYLYQPSIFFYEIALKELIKALAA